MVALPFSFEVVGSQLHEFRTGSAPTDCEPGFDRAEEPLSRGVISPEITQWR
jgi:hypothetical protein